MCLSQKTNTTLKLTLLFRTVICLMFQVTQFPSFEYLITPAHLKQKQSILTLLYSNSLEYYGIKIHWMTSYAPMTTESALFAESKEKSTKSIFFLWVLITHNMYWKRYSCLPRCPNDAHQERLSCPLNMLEDFVFWIFGFHKSITELFQSIRFIAHTVTHFMICLISFKTSTLIWSDQGLKYQ